MFRYAACLVAVLAIPAASAVDREPVITSVTVTPANEAFSIAPWLADFRQIETVLAAQEPNLEWSVKERGLDLAQIAQDSEAALHGATSNEEARTALRNFIAKLGDGHVSLVFPDEKPDNAVPWGTASVCKSLGYEQEDRPAGLAFDRAGGRAVQTGDSALFPLYVLDLPAGRMGVLRIPSFYEWGYFDFCPEAVAEIGLPDNGECDEACGSAIGQKAAELLTRAMARQIARLKQEGVSAIAVDITQNGGGSLWLDPVARMLTGVKLKAPRLAFTRTQGWRDTFSGDLTAIDADLANPELDAKHHEVLTTARATIEAALKEASAPCDRSGIWSGKTPGCSVTAPDLLYATGILDYAPPGEYSQYQSASTIFYSSLYPYQEGLWSGPLYVLMDEGSASAAEHFATILRDNHAATLIGEPTYGAGCGWMGAGDQPVTLKESRAELHVPDCIWVNAKGDNEVAGLEPDILVPWRYYDNAFQKARRAVAILKDLDTTAWHSTRPASPPDASVGRAGQN